MSFEPCRIKNYSAPRDVRFVEYVKGKVRYGRGKAIQYLTEGGSQIEAFHIIDKSGRARWICADEVRSEGGTFSREKISEIRTGYKLQEIYKIGGESALNLPRGLF